MFETAPAALKPPADPDAAVEVVDPRVWLLTKTLLAAFTTALDTFAVTVRFRVSESTAPDSAAAPAAAAPAMLVRLVRSVARTWTLCAASAEALFAFTEDRGSISAVVISVSLEVVTEP